MAMNNPFETADFTKYMAGFKIPAFDIEKLMAVQRKNFETLASANKLATENAQAIFKQQSAVLRENVEEISAVLQELTVAGDPQDKLARQAAQTKDTVERATSNLKELSESVWKSNNEVFEVLNKRFIESLEELKTVAAKTGK